MSKLINFEAEAQTKLKQGVDILANAVKITLGPKGRNVILDRPYGIPHVTKDGVSVAKEIELEDPVENAGAQLAKSVAAKTCEDAGDGTTTSTVLAQAIINEGIKNIVAGANPMEIKQGIDQAVQSVVEFIKESSIIIGDDFNKIEQVATVSANNDSGIGKLIAEAFKAVSKDGVITIEDGKSSDTTITIVEGMRFDSGYASPYFVTNTETNECVLENPCILTYNGKLDNIKDFVHILESVITSNKALLIIANDFDSEVLSTLVANKIKNNFKICAIKSPGFGENKREYLSDISEASGCTLITNEFNNTLPNSLVSFLGSAEKVIVTKNTTTIVNGAIRDSEEFSTYKKELISKYNTNPTEILKDRISKLSGGIAVIYVGANSEVEAKEKKDRIEDALCATRAALEEGIVPGGGTAYIEALPKLLDSINTEIGDVRTGMTIIYKAIQKPLYTIAFNAGIPGDVVVENVKNSNSEESIGYNAKKNCYENMFTAGIVDPAKVTRVALENAASIASLILTAGCVVCDKPTIS